MATQTVNLPYDTSTSANYKSIMMQFGIALLAFGWVQTADTGQVSWAGISTLPGNGTFRDWEIWRMADTAQATNPIFMKLEYSTFGTNTPLFRVTIGTGSNGSGTITGTVLYSVQTITLFQTTSLGAGVLFPCFYSGDSGRFSCFCFGNTGGEITWSIERSKDVSGVNTDEFMVATFMNFSNGSNTTGVMTKTGFTGTFARCLGFFNGSTNNFAGTTAACPQFAMVGKLSNPLMGLCFVPNGDIGQGATVTVNIYSATHTYLATKTVINNLGPSGCLGYGGNSTGLLVRFE